MSDAEATWKCGTGRIDVAKQGHMAGHEHIQGLLDGDEALCDDGRIGRRRLR
jgi:hypothetical protein